MTRSGRRFGVGDVLLDGDRQARGEVVGVYPSPLVVRLVDKVGFQWIARTVACEPADGRPVARKPEPVRVPPGCAEVECPPNELRVGDQVMAGGRLVAIVDLRYRHGGTRTMILQGGAVCAAERTVRVYRRHPVPARPGRP